LINKKQGAISVKTFSPNAEEAKAQREWWVVDATGQTLGRLATQIATVLRGKHKPTFTTHMDSGDFVIVTNCDKIIVTGDKLNSVQYYRHSRFPGGLKSRSMREQLDRFPDRVIFEAVKGMMPKTRLGRAQMKKLRIYAGDEHPHSAQQPKSLSF
jgi:large subunit ribosomal protein L13